MEVQWMIYLQTEDGSMNAVPQILYDQYPILGAFASFSFRPKNQSFCRQENQLHFSMNKGLTVPK